MNKEELYEKLSKQEVLMSYEERMEEYFKGNKVDFQPYGINGPDFAIANYLGYKTTDLMKDPNVAKEVAEEKEKLGLVGNDVFLEGKMMAALLGSELVIPEDGIPRNAGQVLKDYKDLDKIMEIDLVNSELYRNTINNAKNMMENQPDIPMTMALNGPITFAATIRPIELMLRDMRKDFKNYDKLMNFATDKLIEWIQLCKEELGSMPMIFMDPVSTTTILSKEQFQRYSLPYLKRFVESARDILEMPISVHICGKTNEIWEDLAELNFMLFSVDDAEDMEEMKVRIGDQLIISGNIPPIDVLRYGTIDDVIDSVIETLIKAADSPSGFIIDAGCMITPGTPRENLWAFVYAVREFGRGAELGKLPNGVMGIR